MLKKIFFLVIFIFVSHISKSQTIENIQHKRDANKILITYSITQAKFYQSFNIEVYISFDEGENFVGPLKAIDGDVGENISAGKNKRIYWDVFREFDQLKGEIIFDIRAKVVKNIDKKYFIVYQANNITPFGLKIGHVGLFGWYVSAFANTNMYIYDYEYDNDIVQEYPVDQYYEITDEKKYARYSIVAGVNYQIFKNLYFDIGLGYGYKELILQIDEYAYNNNEYLQQSYIKNVSESYGGLEFESGLMYKWNNFVFSGGINTLNFKRLDWNIGIGYCF